MKHLQHLLLKQYTDEVAKEFVSKAMAILKKEAFIVPGKKPNGDGEFEVIMTAEVIDRDGEVIKIDGGNFDNFMKNPVVLALHDYWSLPIGAVTEITKVNNTWVAKGVFARSEAAQEVRRLYDDGFIKTVSIGFIPKEREGNLITVWELLELSFVPVPSNPDAVDIMKGIKKNADYKSMLIKTAVSTHEPPIAPEVTEWKANEAIQRLKEWASSDESGDLDKVDFKKYATGFAYFDENNAKSFDAYLFPHHDVINGELKTIWHGVAASMAKLLGENTDLDSKFTTGIHKHLAKHYAQFDKETPELKSYTQYEIDKIFGEAAIKTEDPNKDKTKPEGKEDVDGDADDVDSPDGKETRTLSAPERELVKNAVEVCEKALEPLKALLRSSAPSPEDAKASQEAKHAIIKTVQDVDKLAEKLLRALKDPSVQIS